MPIPLLQAASWPTLHPVLISIFTILTGAALGFMATRYWKQYDAELSDKKEIANAAREASKADAEWRKSRLDAEQRLDKRIDNLFKQQSDALKQETSDRVKWQLENDSDLARIADILRNVNETQNLTATLAADSKHHDEELKRINTRVEEISKQLNTFIMSHVNR